MVKAKFLEHTSLKSSFQSARIRGTPLCRHTSTTRSLLKLSKHGLCVRASWFFRPKMSSQQNPASPALWACLGWDLTLSLLYSVSVPSPELPLRETAKTFLCPLAESGISGFASQLEKADGSWAILNVKCCVLV